VKINGIVKNEEWNEKDDALELEKNNSNDENKTRKYLKIIIN